MLQKILHNVCGPENILFFSGIFVFVSFLLFVDIILSIALLYTTKKQFKNASKSPRNIIPVELNGNPTVAGKRLHDALGDVLDRKFSARQKHE